MTLFVILRMSDQRYVADRDWTERTGQSYTTELENARTFSSREAALRHKCAEGETVIDVLRLLRDPDDSMK